jgi:hypothetical protein
MMIAIDTMQGCICMQDCAYAYWSLSLFCLQWRGGFNNGYSKFEHTQPAGLGMRTAMNTDEINI